MAGRVAPGARVALEQCRRGRRERQDVNVKTVVVAAVLSVALTVALKAATKKFAPSVAVYL